MPVSVSVTGLERAVSLLRLVEDGAKEAGRTHARLGSGLPYAYWINYGRYASGRPGRRRAGPARFLEAGLDALRESMAPSVARNLERGPQAVRHGITGVLGAATRAMRARTPVVTGALRDSLHSTGYPRGGVD